MTVDELLHELGKLSDVAFHPGASEDTICSMESRCGLRLPSVHRELLLRTNGIEAAGGYIRLYGVGPGSAVDMETWNAPDLWKFAWHPFLKEFLCVGGNPWGSQFAFRLSDIRSEAPDAPMYMLAETQEWARPSRQTFSQYLDEGFLTNARTQLSAFNRKVRKKFGDLAPGELLALSPHPVLGGPERVGNVVKMPAVTAMVVIGDTVTELRRVTENHSRDGKIVGVVPYVDQQGRGRIRLEFQADPA